MSLMPQLDFLLRILAVDLPAVALDPVQSFSQLVAMNRSFFDQQSLVVAVVVAVCIAIASPKNLSVLRRTLPVFSTQALHGVVVVSRQGRGVLLGLLANQIGEAFFFDLQTFQKLLLVPCHLQQ